MTSAVRLRRGIGTRRIGLAALGALCLAALAACDPCSGVIGCAEGDYLSAAGQIVDAASGKGIDGVRVDVVRTSGLAVARDSLSDVTHDGGFWRVEFATEQAGALDAKVVVAPPGMDSYRLHDVRLETRAHRGDANLNERWVPFLYFIDIGEFFVEGTADERLRGAAVEFRRTSGPVLSGPGVRDGVFRTVTDDIGRVYFFPRTGDNAVSVREESDVVGELTVRAAGSPNGTTLQGIRIAPKHVFADRRAFPPVIRLPIRP